MNSTTNALVVALRANNADPETITSVQSGKWTTETIKELSQNEVMQYLKLQIGQAVLVHRTAKHMKEANPD